MRRATYGSSPISANHDFGLFAALLRRVGTLCLVGAPQFAHPAPNVWPLVFGHRPIASSLIGDVAEIREMQGLNDAYERMLKRDLTYRFVVDVASLGT